MLDDPVLVNLVVAHGLEAKPLLAMFDLQPQEGSDNVYVSNSGVRLIVTGMGRHNVEYSLAKWAESAPSARRDTAWLNIGIAGHQNLAVGDTLIANKIIGGPDIESVFPTPIIGGLRTGTVITVDQPELNYPENAAYDMEAFAFWRSAAAFGPLDLVQSYKIVSDNPDSSTDKVTPTLIAELFDSASREIEHLMLQLKALAEKQQSLVSDPPAFLSAKVSYRLSVTQEIQLRRLCHRFYALQMGDSLEVILSRSHRDSRALIGALHVALGHADDNLGREGGEALSQVEAIGGQTERDQAN
jgi:nucleoside phosphorylase